MVVLSGKKSGVKELFLIYGEQADLFQVLEEKIQEKMERKERRTYCQDLTTERTENVLSE
jgi:hypothetical protein